MTTLVPLLVALVGAFVYAVSDKKVAELGRIAFFCGLVWLVYEFAGKQVHF
jgi:Na+/phosphate symporter